MPRSDDGSGAEPARMIARTMRWAIRDRFVAPARSKLAMLREMAMSRRKSRAVGFDVCR